MKRSQLIVGFAFLGIGGYVASSISFAQTGGSAPQARTQHKGYFVFIYRPGPAWVKGKSIQEQPSLDPHLAHMTKLEESGELILGGPFKDDKGAMGVVEFETLEAATKAVMSDPIVRAQVLTAEVHPWYPAVTGRIEKRPW